jgi:putative ABC transport system permease protein
MRMDRFLSFDGLLHDLRDAVRGLRRAPGFALGAMVILGLGIGANTTMFSAVNTILLEPLGYAEPARLVTIQHGDTAPVSAGNFLDWRAQSRAYERMGAAEYWRVNLDAGDHAERVLGIRLTADILPLLGVPPLLGRVFSAEDEVPGQEHKLVLGYALWQRRFGGDPSIVGRTVTVDGEGYDVIGVMPRSFAFAPFWAVGSEMWAPLSLANRQGVRRGNSLRLFARLAPGVSLAQARAEIADITARLEQAYPGTNRNVRVTALTERVVGNTRLALLVLLAAVGFVLLIACANVAHMLLARAAARQREVAVRLALGATRWQIVRQHLVESVLLSVLSGVAGLVLAVWGIRMLTGLAPRDLPRIEDVTIDARVLAFTLGVSLLTGLLFGLVPALQAWSAAVGDTLKDGGRGSLGTKRGSRLRDLLVVSELALAIVLLVGAGLMIRSFDALQAIDAGFDPRHVLSMVVSVRGAPSGEPARRTAFYRRLVEDVRALPGIASASAINHLPVSGDMWDRPFIVDGRPRPKPGDENGAVYRVVLPRYFETMKLPILRGRDITDSDNLSAPLVVIINDYMARKIWPGEDPIGKRIALPNADMEPREWLTVVGVVKNAVLNGWNDDRFEEMYLPYYQSRVFLESNSPPYGYLTLVARAAGDGDPAALASSVRRAIWSIDKAVALADVNTMEAVIDRAVARPRFQLMLLASFAGVALLLAAAGIYGLMSYAIARRTHEIGLRMTLGAQRGDVLRMVLGQAMVRVGAGAAIGLIGALALTRLMSSLLFGVRPTDPLTFGVVAIVLVGAALLASYVPARRATRIDPMSALRQP